MSTATTPPLSLTAYIAARAKAAEALALASADPYAGSEEEAELRRRQLAEYATRRLLAIEREIALARAQAEAALADIRAWLAGVLAPLEERHARELLHLRALGEAHLAAHPKGAKHLDVRVGRGSARLSFSRAPGSLKVLDAEVAIAALQEAGLTEALKVEEIPAKTVVKPVLAELKKLLVKPASKAGGAQARLPAVVAATGEVLAGLGWELDPELRVKVEPPTRFGKEEAEAVEEAGAWPEQPREPSTPSVSPPIYEASARERLLARVAADPEGARRELPGALVADVLAELAEREAVLADHAALDAQEAKEEASHG